jgi:putative nucleotidyltransferase with HDIG domain
MNRREEILEKIKTVDALPPAAAKVTKLVQEDDVNLSELTKTIEFDPGLTSNLLKLANSAELGGIDEINTLRKAIVRLGMKRIFQLVMLSAVSPVTQRAVQGYALPPGELWEHSIAVAIGVGKLSEILDIRLPEYAFTAGLLHDIGKIVLGTFIEIDSEPIMELAFKDKIPFDKAEERVLGINHAEVGAVLLENWGLPKDIIDVTRWHHDSEQFPGDGTVVELVHIADGISTMFGIGVRIDGLYYHLSEEILSRFNIKNRMIESVACNTMSSLEEIRGLFTRNNARIK